MNLRRGHVENHEGRSPPPVGDLCIRLARPANRNASASTELASWTPSGFRR